jgi:hypothetical protein
MRKHEKIAVSENHYAEYNVKYDNKHTEISIFKITD